MIERCRDAIEPTSMEREAIEDPGTFSIDPSSYREGVEIAIRNSLRTRQISRCRGGVEEVSSLLKNSFSRREKHRYECNQACNTIKDPINILNSQKHLSRTNFKHKDPKNTHTHTHTHTLNKSNQFYISKISQDSLVSIH